MGGSDANWIEAAAPPLQELMNPAPAGKKDELAWGARGQGCLEVHVISRVTSMASIPNDPHLGHV